MQQITSSLNLRIIHDCTKWSLCCEPRFYYLMAETVIRQSILHNVTHFGVRVTIGIIFIMHSLVKFGPGFAENLPNMGFPA